MQFFSWTLITHFLSFRSRVIIKSRYCYNVPFSNAQNSFPAYNAFLPMMLSRAGPSRALYPGFTVVVKPSRKKSFCYTNKLICYNRDNKNILLQQQNVWFYQQKVWMLRRNFWLQQEKIYLLSLILLPQPNHFFLWWLGCARTGCLQRTTRDKRLQCSTSSSIAAGRSPRSSPCGVITHPVNINQIFPLRFDCLPRGFGTSLTVINFSGRCKQR